MLQEPRGGARSTLVNVRGEVLGGQAAGTSLCLRPCPSAGVLEHGPVGPCALALAPLGACSVPLGTQVLLDWERNFVVPLFYLENNRGKLTSWCELPLEHLLSLDRSVLAHSRLR